MNDLISHNSPNLMHRAKDFEENFKESANKLFTEEGRRGLDAQDIENITSGKNGDLYQLIIYAISQDITNEQMLDAIESLYFHKDGFNFKNYVFDKNAHNLMGLFVTKNTEMLMCILGKFEDIYMEIEGGLNMLGYVKNQTYLKNSRYKLAEFLLSRMKEGSKSLDELDLSTSSGTDIDPKIYELMSLLGKDVRTKYSTLEDAHDIFRLTGSTGAIDSRGLFHKGNPEQDMIDAFFVNYKDREEFRKADEDTKQQSLLQRIESVNQSLFIPRIAKVNKFFASLKSIQDSGINFLTKEGVEKIIECLGFNDFFEEFKDFAANGREELSQKAQEKLQEIETEITSMIQSANDIKEKVVQGEKAKDLLPILESLNDDEKEKEGLKVEINSLSPEQKSTLLIKSIIDQNLGAVQFLLENDFEIDANTPTSWSEPPIYYTLTGCKEEDLDTQREIASYLMEKGANNLDEVLSSMQEKHPILTQLSKKAYPQNCVVKAGLLKEFIQQQEEKPKPAPRPKPPTQERPVPAPRLQEKPEELQKDPSRELRG